MTRLTLTGAGKVPFAHMRRSVKGLHCRRSATCPMVSTIDSMCSTCVVVAAVGRSWYLNIRPVHSALRSASPPGIFEGVQELSHNVRLRHRPHSLKHSIFIFTCVRPALLLHRQREQTDIEHKTCCRCRRYGKSTAERHDFTAVVVGISFPPHIFQPLVRLAKRRAFSCKSNRTAVRPFASRSRRQQRAGQQTGAVTLNKRPLQNARSQGRLRWIVAFLSVCDFSSNRARGTRTFRHDRSQRVIGENHIDSRQIVFRQSHRFQGIQFLCHVIAQI